MALPDERIFYLLETYTSQKATAAEEEELMTWMREAGEDAELKQYMQQLWDQYQPGTDFSYVNWDGMFNGIIPQEVLPSVAGRTRVFRWKQVAAAAAAVLLISSVIYFWPGRRNEGKLVTNNQELLSDQPPGREGAILTLADGSQLVLDSLGNGKIAVQNGGEVVLENGQLSYVGTDRHSSETAYNTMNTPKGRQFKLSLPDGTGVWLNSASSIRYPTVFTGKERRVSITGEAFFEVAKNSTMPFLVDVNGGSEVQVLGTSFNVNAYQDRGLVKTTLLQGSVRILSNGDQQVLLPGQQAQLSGTTAIKIIEQADIGQVTAWKNGLFNFNNEDLRSVMEEIGRWYDMEIVYESEPAQKEITGEMQRNLSLAQVMNVLKKLQVHYRLDGKKLIITK